jgi:serine/threonine protein kinase
LELTHKKFDPQQLFLEALQTHIFVMPALSAAVEEHMKKHCPELNTLPPGWSFRVDADTHRIVFRNPSGEINWDHPTFMPLPHPWILRLMKDREKGEIPVYYNPVTKKTTKQDPRFMPENLKKQASLVPERLRISATTTKNKTGMDINHLKRQQINRKSNITSDYTIIKTIDDGQGGIGGMNGGVFVVVVKNTLGPPFIEKRFKPTDVSFCKKEIEVMHKLRHPSLATYVNGFILERTPETLSQASVYIEFCNAGSMEDMIKTYRERSLKVPEGFIWHALLGLADALAYLFDGVSHLHNKNARPDPKWRPILHRDIKPDNVLFRTRSTVGSKKYLYCILSDFGLACEDLPNNHPDQEYHQKHGGKLGTMSYLAPELCYKPYPNGKNEEKWFPGKQRHSPRSDIWALGACIHNLCEPNSSHLNPRVGAERTMDYSTWASGTASRRNPLKISSSYSSQLREAVLLATAWNPDDRPGPVRLIETLDRLCDRAGLSVQNENAEPLPDWAYKVHDYANLAAKAKGKR